jgi:hypothetical protein
MLEPNNIGAWIMTLPCFSRRQMLKATSCGFGYLALAGLANQQARAASPGTHQNPLAPRATHFRPRAKRIIFLYMSGGPSQVDTFDYKPLLFRDNLADNLLRPPCTFSECGASRLPISDFFTHVQRHADELCVINSLTTDVPNHPQACLMLHTGDFRFPRPSMGSWLLYGLGTENQNLPGFITISPTDNHGGAQNYSNGFLPANYQALRIGDLRTPVARARIDNLTGTLPMPLQRRQLDLVQAYNQDLLTQQRVNTELEGVIDSYELAFRMQNTVPALMDLSREPLYTQALYGIGEGQRTDNFGRQCLMARRFVEAGVRFVEVCHGNWDMHSGLVRGLEPNIARVDRPIAGLLTDLKQRGLLDDTLVMWGGEFGRTPTKQGNNGRNHNVTGFTMWLAGGGVKRGTRIGATDETGARAVENSMHHHDLHATILHLMGLDHQRLTYRYGGRDYSLTDIHGRVVREILA